MLAFSALAELALADLMVPLIEPVPDWMIERVAIERENRTVIVEAISRVTIGAEDRTVCIARANCIVVVRDCPRIVSVQPINPVTIPFDPRTVTIRRAT